MTKVIKIKSKFEIIVDYRLLKQAITHGLKIRKIHRVIKYEQRPLMKLYIDKNTDLRIKSTSVFDKDFFKLMNNSVFGKTIENVMKRQDIKFVTERNKAIKYTICDKKNFRTKTNLT